MSEPREMMKKMCVIGDGAVGKSSLIRRFVVGDFDDKYIVTIGTKTSAKQLEIVRGSVSTHLRLQIWDILGTRGHAKIQKTAYKGADGAFMVVDLTRKETLYSFDLWLYSLYGTAGEIPVVILANKCDMVPEFSRNRIEDIADEYGFPFFFTSAKTGEGVEEAFNTLGQMMVQPWAGVKTRPRLDMSKVLAGTVEPESIDNLTALEVEDMIMVSYCELLKDTDLAMGLFREQVQRAEVDFMNPTEQDLSRIADCLISAASGRVDPSQLEREREVYSQLISRIG